VNTQQRRARPGATTTLKSDSSSTGSIGGWGGESGRTESVDGAAAAGGALPTRRTCCITSVAPTTITLRNASSPARVITPNPTLPRSIVRAYGRIAEAGPG
jgi:hypothetical protein